ncbi:kinase-like domain-containing protein [Mycena polygramma]|nr:kinase-like domain-containing protein [Mycena polygramma]
MSDSAGKGEYVYRQLLSEEEQFWLDNQPFLLSRGYQLRPRYRPDWVPSWPMDPNGTWGFYEDGIRLLCKSAIDATRIHDDRKVVLKRVATDGEEISIIKYLDSSSMRSDPRNHTIPLLEEFHMPGSPWSFLVMPYGREFDYPPFHCRKEFLEAMTQFLEGLQFMHDHNIAHFDIAPQNMMMDESRVIPKGSHFAEPRSHTGFYGLFSWNNRCTVGPSSYFYIDFGLSLYYPNGKDTALHLGTLRTFRTIPELSQTVPYNPFKVDIFQLGLTIRKLIDACSISFHAYPDLEDFRSVASSMTATNPDDRLTPADALLSLQQIAATLPSSKLSEQIWEKGTTRWQKLSRAILGGYRYDYEKFDFTFS